MHPAPIRWTAWHFGSGTCLGVDPAVAKEAIFTLKLEAELRDQFMAEAVAAHRPASQLVREFLRDFVKRQRDAREHDAWFRAEVEQSMREADDPKVKRISHEEVASRWRRQPAALLRRTGEHNG